MHCLPQRLNSTFFEKNSNGARGMRKISKTLILVFEVIVQPPKAHFLTFLSETKIMTITHSARPAKLWVWRPPKISNWKVTTPIFWCFTSAKNQLVKIKNPPKRSFLKKNFLKKSKEIYLKFLNYIAIGAIF